MARPRRNLASALPARRDPFVLPARPPAAGPSGRVLDRDTTGIFWGDGPPRLLPVATRVRRTSRAAPWGLGHLGTVMPSAKRPRGCGPTHTRERERNPIAALGRQSWRL